MTCQQSRGKTQNLSTKETFPIWVYGAFSQLDLCYLCSGKAHFLVILSASPAFCEAAFLVGEILVVVCRWIPKGEKQKLRPKTALA